MNILDVCHLRVSPTPDDNSEAETAQLTNCPSCAHNCEPRFPRTGLLARHDGVTSPRRLDTLVQASGSISNAYADFDVAFSLQFSIMLCAGTTENRLTGNSLQI